MVEMTQVTMANIWELHSRRERELQQTADFVVRIFRRLDCSCDFRTI